MSVSGIGLSLRGHALPWTLGAGGMGGRRVQGSSTPLKDSPTAVIGSSTPLQDGSAPVGSRWELFGGVVGSRWNGVFDCL